MFENVPPSKSLLFLDFPILFLINFAAINKEEIINIVRTVNKTNSANDLFNIRKMSSEIFFRSHYNYIHGYSELLVFP